MADSKMKAVMLTFILLVIALAITPAVGSFSVDATYTYAYQENTLVPAVSNTTTVSYNIRETDEAYVTIVALNVTDSNNTVTSYTYAASGAKTILITGIITDKGAAGHSYYLLITYQTVDLTPAVNLALIALAPLIWVIMVLAIGVAAIYLQLKKI